MNAIRRLECVVCVFGFLAVLPAGEGAVLFQDDFGGSVVNSSNWFIPTWTGPSDGTFVGRTQFRCAQNALLPSCNAGSATITLQTYNPTGFSFYGTDLISARSFSVGEGLDITVRARMNTSVPGIVAGMFLYALKPGSSTLHDEIDSELLTNTNQPQTNIYGNEPLGVGHPQFVPYSGGTAMDYHTYGIRWLPDQVLWFIDGVLVRTSTNNVPTGPMNLHLNLWAPDSGWPQAYSPGIQPTAFPASNQVFSMSVDSVVVQTITAPAQMLSPTNGSTNSSTSTSFSWSRGTNVTAYAMWMGSTPGAYDVHALLLGTNLTQTLVLPAVGGPIYTRLWSLIDGTWQYNDYSYSTPAPVKAAMLSPVPGSTNSSASAAFTWSAGTGPTQYAIWVGSASNAYDFAALFAGTNLSQTLALPATGSNIHVRLWSLMNGDWPSLAQWQFTDYSYGTPTPVKAAMITPVAGSTNGSNSMTFSWSAGTGPTQYALWIGSSSNSYDLYAQIVGTNLSQTVAGLPLDGRTLYVRLWSLMNGDWPSLAQWQHNDYTYRAFNAVKARFTGLTNGMTLTSTNVTLNWDAGVGVSQYALWVGSKPGTYDLYAAYESSGSRTLALPGDGREVYIRLWSLVNGTWKSNDYEFKSYNDPASTLARMLTPTNGTVLAAATTNFTWSAGTGASGYAIWLGSAPGDYDVYADYADTNLWKQVSVPQDGGTLYVRLWSFVGGTWRGNDYVYGTGTGGVVVKAAMTSPANGTALAGTSAAFTWSGGAGASEYAIWAGTTPGSYDLYAELAGTNLTKTVTGLPSDGGPVYVRLWSLVSGNWKFNDYFYSAYLNP